MKHEHLITNTVRARRLQRGLSQQELAERAGVTRQAIGGIEAGEAAASVGVALRLARALGCRVEDLFRLEDEPAGVVAETAADEPAAPGTRVRLARLGGRLAAFPLVGGGAVGATLHPADGVVERVLRGGRRVRVRLYEDAGLAERTVVVAGCDPALALLADRTGQRAPGTRVAWTAAGSGGALAALAAGRVHVAGIHWRSGNDAVAAVDAPTT